jgi:hypothetical protein
MELTGPACTEALSGAEEAGRRERAEDNAGGVRVELGVRQTHMLVPFGNYRTANKYVPTRVKDDE